MLTVLDESNPQALAVEVGTRTTSGDVLEMVVSRNWLKFSGDVSEHLMVGLVRLRGQERSA